jgi:hypothetical protein
VDCLRRGNDIIDRKCTFSSEPAGVTSRAYVRWITYVDGSSNADNAGLALELALRDQQIADAFGDFLPTSNHRLSGIIRVSGSRGQRCMFNASAQ